MSQLYGKLILCVDDEATGLSVRKALLEAQGYRVLAAESGPIALSLFSKEPIDLVVLDYSMPGMEGHDVAEAMKRRKPHVPIIMLSAYVDLPAKTLAIVDACVTKGDPSLLFLQSVSDLLSGNEESRARQAG